MVKKMQTAHIFTSFHMYIYVCVCAIYEFVKFWMNTQL